jgi:hypothetical protein
MHTFLGFGMFASTMRRKRFITAIAGIKDSADELYHSDILIDKIFI